MEISSPSWIPRSTRNRWAWGFAWANVALLLLWNFLPYYEYTNLTKEGQGQWVAEHLVMIEVWPSVFEGLYMSLSSSLDFEECLSIVASMALILMVIMQFLLVPMWRMFSFSRLLRFIPAGVCALGFLAVVYFLGSEPYSHSEMFSFIMLSIIALNFLLSVVILLLYHPESFSEHEA
jgi:hypothetical protein